ncbi:MAG: hypothetical protein ABIA75_00220 [Candidatus Neomarinimicrobiota bacterium]
MIKLKLLLLILLAICAGIGARPVISAQGRITYLTAELVYCDLGSSAGVAVGDTLTVMRRDDLVGLLVVTNLSGNYSVCQPQLPIDQLLLGDRVVLEKLAPVALPAPDKPQQSIAAPQSARPVLRHQGSLSWRYSDSRFSATSYSRSVAALNYSISIDRPRTLRLSFYGNRNFSDQRWNIYQFQLALGSGRDRLQAQLGRVYAPELAGIGITDGAHLGLRLAENWSVGALAGLQPLPGSLDYSTDVSKFGAYGSYRRNHSQRRFATSLATVGQYYGGGIDREYIYHNLRWETRRWLDLSFNQTIDLDRSDNLAYRNSLEWTSLQASLRLKPHRAVTITSRLSSRQRVIYRSVYGDRADSLFSDVLRTGWYNALHLRSERFGALQLSANIKTETGQRSSANFVAVNYSSPGRSRHWNFDLGADYLKNQLLNGLRLRSGINLVFGELGSLSGDYEIFAYGYGNRTADYFRHNLAFSLNWRIRSRWTGSLSADMFRDDSFSGAYLYGGITCRL